MGLQPDELLTAVEAWANQRLANLSPQASTWRRVPVWSSTCRLLQRFVCVVLPEGFA